VSASDFKKQYLQDWDVARESKLYVFAKEYHDRCEAYDRTVCTGPMGRDGILPSSHIEVGQINRNALKVLDDILKRAAQEGFTREEVQREISRYSPDQLD